MLPGSASNLNWTDYLLIHDFLVYVMDDSFSFYDRMLSFFTYYKIELDRKIISIYLLSISNYIFTLTPMHLRIQDVV